MSWALALALAAAAPLVVRHGAVDGNPGWSFWELTPDLAQVELVVVDKPGGAPLASMLPQAAIAALNGGYWQPDYAPTNWVRDRARELRRPSKTKRGGVVAVAGDAVFVGAMDKVPFKAEFAIHNSPMLVEPGGAIGVKKDDGRRAARTIACADGGTLRLVVIQGATVGDKGPTLMETARMLAAPRAKGGFGCGAALNLDGGPSTGVWLSPGLGAPSSPPLVPIGYGIAVLPRRQ